MAYYYVVASLPTLTLDSALPMGEEQFLRTCSTMLDAADFEDVKLILAGRPSETRHPFGRQWAWRDTQLRNAVARARAARRGADAARAQHDYEGFDGYLEKAVSDAMANPSPLEREKALDLARWAVAEELGRAEPFGMAALLAFATKLRLALRWAGLAPEKGKAAAELLIESTLQGAGL